MQIPNYQIHKVLEAFRQQLQQATGQTPGGRSGASEPPNRQFQSMMEKVAAEIVEKLAHGIPPEETYPPAALQSTAAAAALSPNPGSPANHFDFNIIEGDSTKRPRSLSLTDKSFLVSAQK